MNKLDKVLMDKYDITVTTKTVFHYKEFNYDNLEKAVRYAEIEGKKMDPVTAVPAPQ